MFLSFISKRFSFKKNLLVFLFSLLITTIVHADHKKVVIIVPLEHEAMTQIVAGIKESLNDNDVEIIVKNAHADANILLSYIKQMKHQNIDLIIPIGTSTSQTVIAHIKDKPIVCTAAMIDNKNLPLVIGVNDEIKITEVISKLSFLNNITLIYSSNEKVVPEVEELKSYAAKNNISIHLAMVQTLNDLPIAVKNAPRDTQAFLILKDHLIVSGINILKQEAFKREIPIIASDEGSVINGATIALGVREKEIGVRAGLIAKKILTGTKPSDIPFESMSDLTLFINPVSFAKQNILTEENLSALPFAHIATQE
ncbi:ABC transporter substrate binding protein [Rickettsia endosymbiont of Halotydeus destructor]|uniref:ABC transporter substrate binding protein n=1 Tax=Rickettsia endosymbiont of Halotydeus destructor TaxID=2996754 RepID=UPI003BAE6290